jgi:hypothetical protein
MNPQITIKFNPHDIWLGVYWTRSESFGRALRWLDVYVCIVPMLPLRLRFEWGWK